MDFRASLVLLMIVTEGVWTSSIPRPVAVDCESLGNANDFKQRQMWRNNAEDNTTILLFKGEQLKIHIELDNDAILEVLDVRYSNDGLQDIIQVAFDGKKLGEFRTTPHHGWGNQWESFISSGPLGGKQSLKAGQHSFTLKVLDGDEYGVEIDYIRVSIKGSTFHKLDKHDFLCIHKPNSSTLNQDTDNDN